MDVPEEVQSFLNNYPDILQVLTDRSKVLCKLTKHELPMNLESLKSYVQSKKFLRLHSKLKCPEKTFGKIEGNYKEFFIPSRKSTSRLYCLLTRKEVNKLPHELEKYITGYKFQKALYLRKEREQKEGPVPLEIPTEEDVDVSEEEGDDAENMKEDLPYFAVSDEEEEEMDNSENDIENGNGDDKEENEDEEKLELEDVDIMEIKDEKENIVKKNAEATKTKLKRKKNKQKHKTNLVTTDKSAKRMKVER